MNKLSITLLTLLVLVIVAGVGVVLFYDPPSEQPQVVSQPNETDNQLVESDIDTSDWLTYRNEELGFEFKYPMGWKVLQPLDNIVSLLPPENKAGIEYQGVIRVVVKENQESFDIRDYYNGDRDVDLFNDSNSGYEEFFVSGYSAFYFKDVFGLRTVHKVVIPKEKVFFEVEYTKSYGKEEIFEAFLSSLSFF